MFRGDHGGMVGVDFVRGRKFEKNSRPASTVTLHAKGQRYSISSMPIFVSDVERAEEEHLRELLSEHGLEQIQRLSMWGEKLLRSQDVQSQTDMTGLDDISGHIQYLTEKARQQHQSEYECGFPT